MVASNLFARGRVNHSCGRSGSLRIAYPCCPGLSICLRRRNRSFGLETGYAFPVHPVTHERTSLRDCLPTHGLTFPPFPKHQTTNRHKPPATDHNLAHEAWLVRPSHRHFVKLIAGPNRCTEARLVAD